MALRLTDATPSPEQPSKSAAPTVGAWTLLGARADACLAAKDIAGYRALFAEAAQLQDVHERYAARKRLIEAGFSTPGNDVLLVSTVFTAVARETLEILAQDPREPVLLNYAGVAFYETGELTAAEVLFKAALRLDPDLPHVQRNLDEIARRRRENLTAVLPPQVKQALKDLVPRAKRVAAKAKPAEGMTLSLCMIVKDEEAMLGRTLAAVRDYVDEIVVVDTGSSDRTVAIAESFGAKVLTHEWTGDFAEARNVSLEAATGDWIVYLDADEVLVDGDGPRLRELLGGTWREAYYLVMNNLVGDEEDGNAMHFNALRLFRNRPEYRFEGRLHEQWAQNLPGYLPERLVASDVRLHHYGYLGVVRDSKDKSRRNLELLERQRAEGDDSPFLHFNLGSEYMALGEDERSLGEFERAWDALRGPDGTVYRVGFAPSLGLRYVRSLHMTRRYERMRELAQECLERFPGFTDIVLELALAARDEGNPAEAERLLRECLEMGDAPSKYSAAVGGGTYLPRIALAGVLQDTGRLDEAEAEVRHCLTEHGHFIGVIEPYATIRLARGADAKDIVAEIEAAIADLPPGARFMLAVTLHEAGAAEAAEAQLRHVVAAHPDSGSARLALAEALLSQARLDEAVAVLDAIDQDAFDAASAARTTAFARLAAGDAAQARAALERPAVDRLSAVERALLHAWLTATEGGEPPETLPAEAAGPALVMLEALARLEAFDAFEVLAGRYESIDVSWRERREALAAIYLRRGFLESAADEWISVCEADGPDAAALLGLAQVAWARGMDDEAVVFAEEARELEPGHPGAARLLEHLAA